MAQATGSNSVLLFDEESTYGTTPASPAAFVVPFKSEGFAADTELIKSDILSGSRNPTQPLSGNVSVKGSITTELNPMMGTLLKHLIGSVATTGAGPYTHVFKVGALPTSLVFEKQFTDLGTPQFFLYNGMRIASGSFSFAPSGQIETSFDLVGRQRTVSTSSFDAAPTDLGHTPFEGFDAAILEGGASIATVTSVSLEINNDISSDTYTIGGGGLLYSAPEGKSMVSGTLTAVFDSMALLQKAIDKTETSLKITLTKGTGVGSAGNESIEFLIPELRLKENDPTISDSKGILVEMPFEAYYTDSTEASAIQVTLKNTQVTV